MESILREGLSLYPKSLLKGYKIAFYLKNSQVQRLENGLLIF